MYLLVCTLLLPGLSVLADTVTSSPGDTVLADTVSTSQSTTDLPLCPNDWINAHADGCFKFLGSEVNLSWVQAMYACEAEGGHLAEPMTLQQMEFLSGITAGGGVVNWWLGLTDLAHEAHWTWQYSQLAVSDSFWNSGSPSDLVGNRLDCGLATLQRGELQWLDLDCRETAVNGQPIAPVCQVGDLTPAPSVQTTSTPELPTATTSTTTTITTTPTTTTTKTTTITQLETCPPAWSQFQDSCYTVLGRYLTWLEARAECQKLGGDLASSLSREEDSFIDMVYNSGRNSGFNKNPWLGGTDSSSEGSWSWVYGRLFNYTNWARQLGYDGNNGPQVNCISMVASSYGWSDRVCFNTNDAVCKIYL